MGEILTADIATDCDVQLHADRRYCLTDLTALEEERRGGLLVGWEELVAQDASATFFQSPVWCMQWYRSYRDRFHPLVLVMATGSTLKGIAPMAVEVATNRLTFAGDNMSDYRDVVAVDGYRETLLCELINLYCSSTFSNPLRVGPSQPHSETPHLLSTLNGRRAKARFILRSHNCWRLLFDEGTPQNFTRKESVRRHLNYYKRQGEVALERIETVGAWEAVKEEFYDHHSQRQLQAGRPVSFDDARKRELFDELLRADPSAVHITVLKVGGRVIAEHYGFVSKGMLYWGAPAFDTAEEKHSPGQILLALLLQRAQENGCVGIDFTLGTEDFKKRFGNRCVDLQTVEVYSRAKEFYARRLRDGVAAGTKAVIGRVAGP